jgi:NAD+ synthase (glutamine-hydrolysing)
MITYAQCGERAGIPPYRRVVIDWLSDKAAEKGANTLTVPAGPSLIRLVDRRPFVPADQAARSRRSAEVIVLQSQGLVKRLDHTRAKSAVIGISGGLDSTLALLVTVRALHILGRPLKDALAVTMPCFGTSQRTHQNAVALAHALGAQFREVNIEQAVRRHFADIGHDEAVRDVVYENAQARERTQVLMDLANQTNGIVVGTGDLSELALGWATYNGDHMSMYGVNSSIPKTLVRYLVEWFADEAAAQDDSPLSGTLRDILVTPVSPELLPPEKGAITQKTEELVGPYELHDFFLYYTLRWGFGPEKIFFLAKQAFTDIPAETIRVWLGTFYRRFFAQQFKRSCMPDGAKVGTVNLSPRGDWRMPSDASAGAWERELKKI